MKHYLKDINGNLCGIQKHFEKELISNHKKKFNIIVSEDKTKWYDFKRLSKNDDVIIWCINDFGNTDKKKFKIEDAEEEQEEIILSGERLKYIESNINFLKNDLKFTVEQIRVICKTDSKNIYHILRDEAISERVSIKIYSKLKEWNDENKANYKRT